MSPFEFMEKLYSSSAFTPSYRRTYTRVGMVPQQNNEKPRPAWTSHMSAMCSGRGDAGTLNDWMSGIGRCTLPPFRWGWSHHFSVQQTRSSTQLPEGCWPHQGQSRMILDRAPEKKNNNNAENARQPTFVFVLGTVSRGAWDDRRCLTGSAMLVRSLRYLALTLLEPCEWRPPSCMWCDTSLAASVVSIEAVWHRIVRLQSRCNMAMYRFGYFDSDYRNRVFTSQSFNIGDS